MVIGFAVALLVMTLIEAVDLFIPQYLDTVVAGAAKSICGAVASAGLHACRQAWQARTDNYTNPPLKRLNELQACLTFGVVLGVTANLGLLLLFWQLWPRLGYAFEQNIETTATYSVLFSGIGLLIGSLPVVADIVTKLIKTLFKGDDYDE